ncbi:MAG TPA: C-type lectin domain-containing protein [Kofleriaceae bacterium]|nr:C-type lectin domain-containing protein [Kofleriaceae bacterium]
MRPSHAIALLPWLVVGCRFEPRALELDAPEVPPGDGMPDVMIPDAAPCPGAPVGCVGFTCGGTSCYYVCTSGSWAQSRDKCVAQDLGCLVTIESAAENQCIRDATLPVFPNLPYIGLYQPIGSSEPTGGWTWQCGSSAYTTPGWGMPGNEPNNLGGDENCGVIAEDAGWVDIDCATQRRYVCELTR